MRRDKDEKMTDGTETKIKKTSLHLFSSHPLIFISHHPSFAWLRRNLTLILIAAAVISAAVTYVTVSGSAAPLSMKPNRVWMLLAVNLGLLLALIGTVTFRIFVLWSAMRAGAGNSQLQRRILLLFSLVAITPTIIVSIFSALFFNLGIQTWFNDRVQTAVGESLVVAEAYLAEHKENIRADAVSMAGDLSQYATLALTNPADFNRLIVTQSTLRALTESVVFQHNRVIAQGRLSFALAFERIPIDALERAGQGEVVMLPVEDEDKVRAIVKIDTLDDAYLLVGRLIDSKVIGHMQSAQGAVSEYRALRAQLSRLQIVFSIAFVTLALLLLISSVGYGMIFAARLTNPISGLAAAAERVRGGDFSVRVAEAEGQDEIGTLARSFNRMTEQLEAQRRDLIDANRRLDERRRFSEAVLSGVSAGVIALDRDKRVTLFNRSSAAILSPVGRQVSPHLPIADILPGIQELLAQAEQMPNEGTQGSLTLHNGERELTLHARITVERIGEEIEGFIVTFDDITALVAAQRSAAWADVARRVAHEIKNPLTPIQLAAERLKKKYLRYIEDDQENFIKYIDTISKQVGDIGRMVEEFVSFARMPAPRFTAEDMASIVKKAVFSAQVASPSVEYKLTAPDAPVMLECDERQITQVLTNVLKNAAESIETRLEQQPDSEPGCIEVRLSQETGGGLSLVVEDNGVGFPPGEAKKMLEPYVTTRSKGTGLGLSIVKRIMDDHKGKITLENNVKGGARVLLYFPATL